MNNSSIHSKIIECFIECFSISKDALGSNFSQATYSAWDSLAHLKLLMLVEEKLHITFTIEDIAQISSLKDLIRVVSIKRKK